MRTRCYKELKRLTSFEERYEYLKLNGVVGEPTFGFDRYLNQSFYKSSKWKSARRAVIIRDNGCDLGIEDQELKHRIMVHHMNPITPEDIESESESLYDPEFLITCGYNTHTAITYGNDSLLPKKPIIRTRNDTCPWKN